MSGGRRSGQSTLWPARAGRARAPATTSSQVSIPAPGGPLPSYVATPDGEGPWPGVVVLLHDLVGMSRDLRDQANGLAGNDACPIVGSYGAKDPGLRGAGDRLERILTAVGVDHDVTTYPDAGHSFMNDHDRAELPTLFALQVRVMGDPFHEPSTADARRRILDFFAHHLRS